VLLSKSIPAGLRYFNVRAAPLFSEPAIGYREPSACPSSTDNDKQQLRDTAQAPQTSSDFIRDCTPHDFERVIGKRPLQILRLVRGGSGNRCRMSGAPFILKMVRLGFWRETVVLSRDAILRKLDQST
jgi:hypothetical protein